jgi:hypothetical protein
MKSNLRRIAFCALALTIFLQHGAARAGGGGAFNFQGPSAIANFASIDAAGCVRTDVMVIGSDTVSQNEPGPSTAHSFASITVSKYDVCNGVQLLFAYGSAAPLSDSAFQVSSRLDSATLNARAQMFDEVSGSNFDLDVHLTWTGSGSVSRSITHSNLHSPDCMVNSRSNGTTRTAQAVGSISDGLTDFTPEPSYEGSIVMVRSGTVTVGCD